MKKPWLLILAGVILITLIGIWLYLFFGGDEAKDDLYNAFGLQGDELPFGLEDIFGDSPATSTPQYLRQLSLRQVAGYIPLDNTVLFVESGTGHIYRVRVEDGEEERLSNITIPSAKSASFSPDGNYAAITSEDGRALTVVTLPHSSTTLASARIDAGPISTSFTSDNKLLYAVKDGQSVKGYVYDVLAVTSRPLFSIPFREAVVLWGNTEKGPHYTYPKTAEELEGYLYEINSGTLNRLPISGFDFSARTGGASVLYTKIENSIPRSYAWDISRKEAAPSEVLFTPEKCVAWGDDFVCAIHRESLNLTSWYRGELSSEDSLWYYIPGINYIGLVENITATAGRTIDATQLDIGSEKLFFINKIDNGLWVYARDFASPVTDN